jgi:hypothetical protein|tara:strand:- start:272 stop:682 length:411 start_codon:yes stop_codon:yes gene_type:complete
MESINIREIRRSLKMNRDKFRYDLNYILNLFNVSDDGILKKYDKCGDEIIKLNMEKESIDGKINEVNYEFERLKSGFISNNEIDIRKKVLSLGKRGDKVLNELFKMGFISSDMYEVVKEEMWRNRKVSNYEFGKWM